MRPATSIRSPPASSAEAKATSVRLQKVGSFDSPLYVTAPPGDQRRIFVVQQGGQIKVVRGGKVLAVGTVKGKIKGRKVTKKNVKIPVTLQRHAGATTSQAPNPTPGACQILDLVLQPIDLNLLGLHVATSRIEALIEGVPGAGALVGNLLCAITGILDPQAVVPATPSLLTQVLNALLALLPRTA